VNFLQQSGTKTAFILLYTRNNTHRIRGGSRTKAGGRRLSASTDWTPLPFAPPKQIN